MKIGSNIAAEFLERWPCLEKLQRASPTTIERFFIDHNSRDSERIAEAIGPKCAFLLQRRQVLERSVRFHEHRQQRRVRRDDQLLAQPALEREIGDTESTILIGEGPITNRVRRLRHSPRYATLGAVGDLPAMNDASRDSDARRS